MKNYIFSGHFNNLNFIRLQKLSIEKYFKGSYEYIIFNDAKTIADYTNNFNNSFNKLIHEECNKLNIKCINIPQEIHKNRSLIFPNTPDNQENPTTRCANVIQFMYNYFINNYPNNRLIIIDSDMFFLKEFDIENYMQNYNIAGLLHKKKKNNVETKYLWNGLFILESNNLDNLDEFNWDSYPFDVGAQNSKYLNKYKEKIKLKLISKTHYCYKNDILNSNLNDKLKNFLLNFLNKQNIIYNKNSPKPYKCNICNISFRKKNSIEHHITSIHKLPLNEIKFSINKELLLDNCIIHIRGGGNWDRSGFDYLNKCLDICRNFINDN